MASTQGFNGALCLGGIVDASPAAILWEGSAPASGVATLSITAASQIYGVLFAGDTFTIAGETGSPTHTVTSSLVAFTNGPQPVTFTPALATGGVTASAVVTFTSNSIANITRWDMNARAQMLDATAMGSRWKSFKGGLCQWSGSADAWLDRGDTKQNALIDKIVAASPVDTSFGLVLRLASSKQFYSYTLLRNCRVLVDRDQLIKVSFEFQGDGAVLPNFS